MKRKHVVSPDQLLFSKLEELIDADDERGLADTIVQSKSLWILGALFWKKLIDLIDEKLNNSNLLLQLDTETAKVILVNFLKFKEIYLTSSLLTSLAYEVESDEKAISIIVRINELISVFSKPMQQMILDELAATATAESDFESLQYLTAIGVSMDVISANSKRDYDISTPLIMLATQEDILKFLISQKANLDFQNEHGVTALIHCIQERQSFDKIGLLLEAKADPNLKDIAGKTALSYAVAQLDVERVKKLLPYSNVKLSDNFENGLLHELARAEIRKNEAITDVKKMLEIATLLLQKNVDINKQNTHGCTPLMEALKVKNTTLATFFIKEKCNLSLVNAFGNNAYELAYLYHPEVLSAFPERKLIETYTDRMKLELSYGYFREEITYIAPATLCILLAHKMARRHDKGALPFFAYVLKSEELNEFYLAMKGLFESGKFNGLRIFVLITIGKHWQCIDLVFTTDSDNKKQAKAFILEATNLWHGPSIVEPLCQAIPDIKISSNVGVIQHDYDSCAFMSLDYLTQSSTISDFHEQLVETSNKIPPKENKPAQVVTVELPLKLLRSTQSLKSIKKLNEAAELKVQKQSINSKGNNFLQSIEHHTRFTRNRRIDDKFMKRAEDYYNFIRQHSALAIDKTITERGIEGIRRLVAHLQDQMTFVKDWKFVMLFPHRPSIPETTLSISSSYENKS